jgi:hypothetical protein
MPGHPFGAPTVERARSVVKDAYTGFLQDETSTVCCAAIKALTEDIRRSSATTIMGLRNDLMQAGEALKQCDDAPISIESLCELFVRFVTRTALDVPDFDKCARRAPAPPPPAGRRASAPGRPPSLPTLTRRPPPATYLPCHPSARPAAQVQVSAHRARRDVRAEGPRRSQTHRTAWQPVRG